MSGHLKIKITLHETVKPYPFWHSNEFIISNTTYLYNIAMRYRSDYTGTKWGHYTR